MSPLTLLATHRSFTLVSPEHEQLVEVARAMRDLGVKRMDLTARVIEFHDAACLLALTPSKPRDEDAGSIAAADRQRREDDEAERIALELQSS